MKRPNRDDNYAEWLSPGCAAAARGRPAERKGPSEQLQHGSTGRAVVLLRVIDDEDLAPRQGALDRHDRQTPARQIVGDDEAGRHGDAEARHDGPFDRIRTVERHRG